MANATLKTSSAPRRRAEMKSPGPSPVDIQNHLYMSFLQASTTDVALLVSGSWHAIYRLHKVVLIQSAFFRSLFTSGFSESAPRLSSGSRLNEGVDEIEIQFDDPNITRAAFEVCISRLYGGGPPLHLPAAFKPTTTHPLTPVFPNPPMPNKPDIPAGHHLATPRFLLSLLATSLFLQIPSVAHQALSSVLNTIGPYTAIQYLDFALGKPLGPLAPEYGETEAAVGLESVAKILGDSDSASVATLQSTKGSYTSDTISEDDSHEAPPEHAGISLHYGGISDRIGEATTSWLARWCQETLACEEKPAAAPGGTRKRASTIVSGLPTSIFEPLLFAKGFTIWGRGGLSAEWVKALISSDSLFVAHELERYEFAKSVVELRRAHGILDEEEKIWTEMFQDGIYYANLSMSQIIYFSTDISPTTKRPYVPLNVLQAAQWDTSVLRHLVTYRSSLSSPSSPGPSQMDLGLTETTQQVMARLETGLESDRRKRLFRVSGNSSLRIGEPGNAVEPSSISMDELFALSSSPSKSTSITEKPPPRTITTEATYFGLLPLTSTAEMCGAADPTGQQKWSPYPPFRCAVEFWDMGHLKEMQRLHSQTIWYAGSLFNVYIQVVPKKSGTQIGVYVQRQSNIDPIPRMSSANRPALSSQLPHIRVPSHPLMSIPTSVSSPHALHTLPEAQSPLMTTRSATPTSGRRPTTSSSLPSSSPLTSPSTPHSSSSTISPLERISPTLPASVPGTSPPDQAYRDPRAVLKAYFMVHCASPTGNAQTRFASSPDEFKVSQSWGWKSSSLWTGKSEEPAGKEVSLRATVVLGLV